LSAKTSLYKEVLSALANLSAETVRGALLFFHELCQTHDHEPAVFALAIDDPIVARFLGESVGEVSGEKPYDNVCLAPSDEDYSRVVHYQTRLNCVIPGLSLTRLFAMTPGGPCWVRPLRGESDAVRERVEQALAVTTPTERIRDVLSALHNELSSLYRVNLHYTHNIAFVACSLAKPTSSEAHTDVRHENAGTGEPVRHSVNGAFAFKRIGSRKAARELLDACSLFAHGLTTYCHIEYVAQLERELRTSRDHLSQFGHNLSHAALVVQHRVLTRYANNDKRHRLALKSLLSHAFERQQLFSLLSSSDRWPRYATTIPRDVLDPEVTRSICYYDLLARSDESDEVVSRRCDHIFVTYTGSDPRVMWSLPFGARGLGLVQSIVENLLRNLIKHASERELRAIKDATDSDQGLQITVLENVAVPKRLVFNTQMQIALAERYRTLAIDVPCQEETTTQTVSGVLSSMSEAGTGAGMGIRDMLYAASVLADQRGASESYASVVRACLSNVPTALEPPPLMIEHIRSEVGLGVSRYYVAVRKEVVVTEVRGPFVSGGSQDAERIVCVEDGTEPLASGTPLGLVRSTAEGARQTHDLVAIKGLLGLFPTTILLPEGRYALYEAPIELRQDIGIVTEAPVDKGENSNFTIELVHAERRRWRCADRQVPVSIHDLLLATANGRIFEAECLLRFVEAMQFAVTIVDERISSYDSPALHELGIECLHPNDLRSAVCGGKIGCQIDRSLKRLVVVHEGFLRFSLNQAGAGMGLRVAEALALAFGTEPRCLFATSTSPSVEWLRFQNLKFIAFSSVFEGVRACDKVGLVRGLLAARLL